MSSPLFHEKQQFRQWWIWLLLLSVTGYSSYQYFYENDSIMGMVISISLVILFLVMRLETSIFTDRIHVKFFPFINRRISFSDIENSEIRKYSPLGEYGGWGIRFRRGSIAYNVSGNKGLELLLTNGKTVMIGTQKAVKLKAALSDINVDSSQD